MYAKKEDRLPGQTPSVLVVRGLGGAAAAMHSLPQALPTPTQAHRPEHS